MGVANAEILFGVGSYGTEHAQTSVELARAAEGLGYHRFWIGDSHMIWRELYVLAGAIGVVTRRIEIGPGVTHPEVRHLTVTASAVATLNELTDGRAFLGFGVGATGPGNIGMEPAALPELEESIIQLKKLLAGETLTIGGREVAVFSRTQCAALYRHLGAASHEMTSRLSEVIIHWRNNYARAIDRKHSRFTASATNRERLCSPLSSAMRISAHGQQARESVKGIVARAAFTHLGRLYNRGELDDEADRQAVERSRQHYDTYHHMGPEHDSSCGRSGWTGWLSPARQMKSGRK